MLIPSEYKQNTLMVQGAKRLSVQRKRIVKFWNSVLHLLAEVDKSFHLLPTYCEAPSGFHENT